MAVIQYYGINSLQIVFINKFKLIFHMSSNSTKVKYSDCIVL